MNDEETLRQQLLELIYGLLSDQEQRELIGRISSDPEVARLYAEVSTESELMAKAARLDAPQIPLAKRRVTRGPGIGNAAARSGPAAWLPWIVTLAASLLVLCVGGGYGWVRLQHRDLAADHLRLLVAAPSSLAPGVDGRVTVRTESLNGRPLATEVSVNVFDKQDRPLMPVANQTRRTGADGRADFTIPTELNLAGPLRLEVQAYNGANHPQMKQRLDVEPQRYVTQVAMDKPWYQPGETVAFRSLTLDSFSLAARREVQVEFELLDPSGAPVPNSKTHGVTQFGVGNRTFTLPPEAAGGMYTLVARSLEQPTAFPEQKNEFLVQRYVLPRLKKELEFVRDSYGPGDSVVADFSAVRAEGGPAAGAKLRIVATVDGQTVYTKSDTAAANGTYQVRFTLPKKIEKEEAQLAVIVDDGGTSETSAKTIPINLGKVAVDFYPEGGDLAAGVPNRVYFAAHNASGEPVHIEGQVLDTAGRAVAPVATVHEGRGSFRFTPSKDQIYTLKITKPDKVVSAPKLPSVNPLAPVVLSTGPGVFDAGKPLKFSLIAAREKMPLAVTAYCRGVPVGQTTHITGLLGSEAPLTISLSDAADGVIRLTVYDYSDKRPVPIAERLVYRRPARTLNVALASPDARLSPGDHADITLKVTDEHGRGVPAILGVAVVDDALLSLAKEGTKHQPAMMPTHFRLGCEIEKPEELENVNFYLSDDAKAPAALDLLLGTQGWRRFISRQLDALTAKNAPDSQQAREALARIAAISGLESVPAVYDNLAEVQPAYESRLADQEALQQHRLMIVGRIGVIGGVALMALLGLLGMLRLLRTPRYWVPALTAAACCLLLGVVWMGTEAIGHKSKSLVAYRGVIGDDVYADDADGRKFGNKKHLWEIDGKEDKDKPQDDKPQDLEVFDEQGGGVKNQFGGNLDLANIPRAVQPMKGNLAVNAGGKLNRENAHEEGLDFKKQAGAGWGGARVKGLEGEKLAKGDFQYRAGLDQDITQLRRRMLNAASAGRDAEVIELAKQLDKLQEAGRFPVRQYAHRHTPGEAGVRSDFAETLYWNPLIIADSDGNATIHFDLSDAVTTLRVLADAHASDSNEQLGRIGTGGGSIVSRIPFSLEPKLPLEVNAGDRIDLPVAIANDTPDGMTVELKLQIDKLLEFTGEAQRRLDLTAASRSREFFPLSVVGQQGVTKLRISGTAGTLSDMIEKTIKVVPAGFPVAESFAGRLDGEHKLTVTLPKDWVSGTLTATLRCYPTTLSDLQAGIESILNEPCGCFEQASTSNYPNVLAMQYMEEHQVADPAVTRRARDLMKSGYAKLTGYECKLKGYEWFGGDPGHEALTAYGLMQFRDMAHVYDVDPAMIKRTSDWLLARRDGKGTFERNPRALDSFGGAPPDVTNAYIVWALTESGQKSIDAEVEHAVDSGRKSEDPYVVALCAASAVNYGQQQAGRELLQKLAKMQADDGHLTGMQGSITRSGGVSLNVETTALAALAWLKMPEFLPQANKAIDWIVKSRQGSGGFGSTQATILALKALVAHAKANTATVTDGELTVLCDDEEIGRTKFTAGERNAITLNGLGDKLKPGENKLTLKLSGENKMPFALDIAYRTHTPVSQKECPVRLTTKLDRETVNAGGTVALLATIENTTDRGQPMTVAILGIPGGTRPRADQLEELKKKGTIDYYETSAREVICYWRSLAPKRSVDLRLDLVAEIPGHYTAPASRAYLYYTAEQKQWVDPVVVEIARP